jgi:hypothetical protein
MVRPEGKRYWVQPTFLGLLSARQEPTDEHEVNVAARTPRADEVSQGVHHALICVDCTELDAKHAHRERQQLRYLAQLLLVGGSEWMLEIHRRVSAVDALHD